MAETQSIIALNIGSQRVSMGLFSPTKGGGLILKKYESSEILADPAAELVRISQIRLAISDLAAKLGVSKQKVDYAISGQSVFTRFVKLPVLDESNIEQLVAFEAQQHVPFPINEVVWDWQMLEASGPEREVVIVAIKSDTLDELNDCVENANLSTGCVDASPMALANAYQFSYGDQDEAALLIDIGARTSNLIYLEGNRVFTRSIAFGGSAITSAIAKEYGVAYMEAESQKVANGMVALDTRHTSQLDELTAALASCIRTALNRMPADIARTTNFFRSQHGGNAPKRVILAGGGANLPMIGEFFYEKLRLPVEYFNPLRNVAVGPDVDVEKVSSEAHLMGELVGLALRSIDRASIAIDLTPLSVQSKRDESRRRPWLIGAAALTLLSFAGLYVNHSSKLSGLTAKQNEVQNRITAITKYSKPITESKQLVERVDAIASQYVKAHRGQREWLEIIDELKNRFGDSHVWVTDFSPVVNYKPGAELAEEVIKGGFHQLAAGTSAMAQIKGEPELLPDGRPNPKYVAPKINAVQIKGLWRGDKGAEKVESLVQKLTNDSEFFTLEVQDTDPRGKEKSRKLDQKEYILENVAMLGEKQYAAPFTLVIPLKQPIDLK